MQQSLLQWLLGATGLPWAITLLLTGLVSLLLVLVVVIRGNGPMAVGSLFLIIPLPLLVGAFAAALKGINAYLVIATSEATPKPSDLAEGLSEALIPALVAMLVTIPGYVAALIGAFVRSFPASEGRKLKL